MGKSKTVKLIAVLLLVLVSGAMAEDWHGSCDSDCDSVLCCPACSNALISHVSQPGFDVVILAKSTTRNYTVPHIFLDGVFQPPELSA